MSSGADNVESLIILSGRGSYPLLLAESARRQGVKKLAAIAFKNETDTKLASLVDEIAWVRIGQLGAALEAIRGFGIGHAVMAGQITPTHLFSMRMDAKMLQVITGLKERNAHTIYGALCDEIRTIGVELLPAHLFMEAAMPEAGQLSAREPDERESADIELGIHVAKATSGLEIGQTVVIKEGTILAVEAFEGTDQTILRAGKLGGKGLVVVKAAKQDHDMRFDIPVIGERTFQSLRKAGASVLAVEAGRAILLERDKLIELANRMNVSFLAVDMQRDQ